jgi:hypothetical protein
VPVLTGLGTDQDHLAPNVLSEQHIGEVIPEVTKSPEPLILAGHGYAGMIFKKVLLRAPKARNGMRLSECEVRVRSKSAMVVAGHFGSYVLTVVSRVRWRMRLTIYMLVNAISRYNYMDYWKQNSFSRRHCAWAPHTARSAA